MSVSNTTAVNQLVINFGSALPTYNKWRCYNPHKFKAIIEDLYLKMATTRLLFESDCLTLTCTGIGDGELTTMVQNIGNLP